MVETRTNQRMAARAFNGRSTVSAVARRDGLGGLRRRTYSSWSQTSALLRLMNFTPTVSANFLQRIAEPTSPFHRDYLAHRVSWNQPAISLTPGFSQVFTAHRADKPFKRLHSWTCRCTALKRGVNKNRRIESRSENCDSQIAALLQPLDCFGHHAMAEVSLLHPQ